MKRSERLTLRPDADDLRSPRGLLWSVGRFPRVLRRCLGRDNYLGRDVQRRRRSSSG
jgi:hypothetical protein